MTIKMTKVTVDRESFKCLGQETIDKWEKRLTELYNAQGGYLSSEDIINCLNDNLKKVGDYWWEYYPDNKILEFD